MFPTLYCFNLVLSRTFFIIIYNHSALLWKMRTHYFCPFYSFYSEHLLITITYSYWLFLKHLQMRKDMLTLTFLRVTYFTEELSSIHFCKWYNSERRHFTVPAPNCVIWQFSSRIRAYLVILINGTVFKTN